MNDRSRAATGPAHEQSRLVRADIQPPDEIMRREAVLTTPGSEEDEPQRSLPFLPHRWQQ